MLDQQYKRYVSLIVASEQVGIDLSEMHFTFETQQADVQSPNSCAIRVYNLSPETVRKITGKNDGVEYSKVTLKAGYESNFGTIFEGNIKQFRRGRENATDTYLDILAADGDLGFNFGFCSQTLAAGSATPQEQVRVATEAMNAVSLTARQSIGAGEVMPFTGGVLPRGKVLFGLARNVYSCVAESQRATWSIQDGKVNIIPLKGFLTYPPVVLNALTGMIGVPEQTDEGIRVRCLLNPRMRVGGRLQIDNKSVNQTIQKNPNVPIPYNQYTGLQFFASVTADGIYRMYVIEHQGGTRDVPWYTDITCLSIDPSNPAFSPLGTVISNG